MIQWQKLEMKLLWKLKKKRPHLTDDEAIQLLESIETFCELVINYTLKHGDIEEDE